jgi:hypothetical protein
MRVTDRNNESIVMELEPSEFNFIRESLMHVEVICGRDNAREMGFTDEIAGAFSKVILDAAEKYNIALWTSESGRREFFACCRVCGCRLDFFPWGAYDDAPSFEICPCCGVQFGVMDETPLLASQERQDWLSKGMPWFQEDQKPENWQPEAQLAQIPPEFIVE